MSNEPHEYPNGIRRIRKKRGLSLKQLEASTGIPNGQISRAERHNFGLGKERWELLAKALGVPTWELHVPVEVEQVASELGEQKP